MVVPGLFATMALPAFGTHPENAAWADVTSDRGADAQTISVSESTEDDIALARDGYGATSNEEIRKAKQEEKERKQAEKAAKEREAEDSDSAEDSDTDAEQDGSGDEPIAGDGEVRWPLPSSGTMGDGFMSRGGSHHGQDILIGGGTPIGAVADGTVVVSKNGYGGYGEAVVIEHTIGGKQIRTTYGHMTHGTRRVSEGDHVSAGQVIGQVGSTGRSTANHLHIEVAVEGSLVDPVAWLKNNGA